MFVISVCGSIWVSIVNVDVVGQCICFCCYRFEHGFVSLDMRTKMLMHLFVVLAYVDNDCKTVLLHLIRGPMTEMASLTTKECDSFDRCMCRHLSCVLIGVLLDDYRCALRSLVSAVGHDNE